jgi:hypothetical protein
MCFDALQQVDEEGAGIAALQLAGGQQALEDCDGLVTDFRPARHPVFALTESSS